jgi:hypothetical protein
MISSPWGFVVGIPPQASNAMQGAAEYDLEYYLRDLFQGNPKEGTRSASSLPTAPPPRVLNGPIPQLLLQDNLAECLPVSIMSRLVPSIETDAIVQRIEYTRKSASRSFQIKNPWTQSLVSDQYYFDLTSYAVWKTASELLPDFSQRDRFARDIGRELIGTPDIFLPKIDPRLKKPGAQLTSTIESVYQILNAFVSSKFCTSFQVSDSQDDGALFDELDDNDFESGVSVDCIISIFNPATLGASLQITGEQSRFIPEFVGTTLMAMWESVGISSTMETYFVDSEYRPNPKDYFPNEQLLQFTLSKKI